MAHDGQDHAHGGHNHAHGANSRAVGIAALLTFGFMLVEVVGGLWAGSLALLADAGHMLTDVAALGMSWLGFWFARRPADAQRTYGFDRVSVLAAFVNGLALFLVAIFIVVEAVRRFADPQPVVGGVMLVVASLGLLVNVGVFWALSRGDRENLNLRAAILHVAGDLLGSVAAMVAGGVILWTGWTPIDPILSVLVSVIILRAAWRVTAESGHILLEGSPGRLDTRAVRADLQGLAGGARGAASARLVDLTGAPDGDARGGGRGGGGRRYDARGAEGAAARGIRLRSRDGRDPCGRRGRRGREVAGGGAGLYLGALPIRERSCRSRSPPACPPTTCCATRA